jgi:hypothetical protein
MVAALFVAARGVYFGLPDVDPWDIRRDARRYAGPHPVVAHPPCSSWCQLAHVNQKRYGHRVGDDGGCFHAALWAVRSWGGVLEHPAESYAWPCSSLPRPARGVWHRDIWGGWTTEVSQSAYGHRARKRTWLYVVGSSPPVVDWSDPEGTALVSFCSNNGGRIDLPRLTKKQAKATPPAFRDLLLSIARSARKAAA